MPLLSVLISCYFNEGNIPVTFPALLENEKNFPDDVSFEYVFVDDGSKDNTYQQLLLAQQTAPEKVTVVKLARNFGANNASLAAMQHCKGDVCVIIAADLQDPPALIPKMYEHWRNGLKLVIANRISRQDTAMTKFFSNTYHKIVKKYALPSAPDGGFDLFLFDKQIKDDILRIDEKNIFLPYLFIWLGYEYVCIPYERQERKIGKSRWTLSKKIKAVVDSFVGFSFLPIRLITISGLFLGLITLVYGVAIIIGKIFGAVSVDGWSSLMVTLLFVSSFQMISLGILGEYIWRSLDAARNRPNFVVDKVSFKRSKDEL